MQKVLIASICVFAFVAGSEAGLGRFVGSGKACEWVDTKPTASIKTVATRDNSVLSTFGTYLELNGPKGKQYLELNLGQVVNRTSKFGESFLTFHHDCAKIEMTFGRMDDDKFRVINLDVKLTEPIGHSDHYQLSGDVYQIKTIHYKCDKQQIYKIYGYHKDYYMNVVVPQFEYEFGGDVAAHKQGKFSTKVLSQC